ncbi:MAG TPA: SUF system NifU family Fe-S cluster assembly protein [Candidatus Thermoplasmatota archaeon]|nr:SUF system NifU family Fe-S cluster assembly protein [Candidatus Thermoplasmatota archaeon]
MVEDMYQEQILDHYQNPRNFGEIPDAELSAHENNPLCGDDLHLFVKLRDGQVIEDVRFKGRGCAISQASASMLYESLKGKSLDEARKIGKDDVLGLLGVPISAARLKCALLSWDVLLVATGAKKEG